MSTPLPALVLPVYKPKDITSFDVIRKLKKKLPPGWKKIGHFGTLDPFATGILLVGVNSALRANNYIQEFAPKTYLAKGVLGIKTESGDNTGDVIETREVPALNINQIQETLKSFIGDYWQSPPYYSAAKHEGRPLYEWARQGVFIDKPQVKRTIYSLNLISFQNNIIEFEVQVSTGTYIRKLIEDIAQKLGTLGHLNYLERTKIGKITTKDLIETKQWDTPGKDLIFWTKHSFPVDSMLILNKAILNDASPYKNGIAAKKGSFILQLDDAAASSSLVWVYDNLQNLLGLGEISSDEGIKSHFNLPTN